MANRLVQNVFIVDSQTANKAVSFPSNMKVSSVALWSTASGGRVVLADATTSNKLVVLSADPAVNLPSTTSIYLGGVYFDSLKVPVLTSGTAFIYFA